MLEENKVAEQSPIEGQQTEQPLNDVEQVPSNSEQLDQIDSTVTEQPISDDTTIKDQVLNAFDEFYNNYVVEHVQGTVQVFQSFTYGEMVISLLLFTFLLLFIFKWIYEVLR